MPIETLIERWLAIFWIAIGLSHLLHPKSWTDLLLPLRERESGALLLGSINFSIGLLIVLGHNVWVWDVPVIVTVAGWLATAKGTSYLLYPRSLAAVMGAGRRVDNTLPIVGTVMILLGAIIGYDAFWRR